MIDIRIRHVNNITFVDTDKISYAVTNVTTTGKGLPNDRIGEFCEKLSDLVREYEEVLK